jgi:hypothetical protein
MATVEVRGSDGTFEEVFTGTSRSCRVSKLMPSCTYEFRASATNAAGKGA